MQWSVTGRTFRLPDPPAQALLPLQKHPHLPGNAGVVGAKRIGRQPIDDHQGDLEVHTLLPPPPAAGGGAAGGSKQRFGNLI